MRIFDNFFLDLDNFFYIINKEKESTKMNETKEQTYPARKVLNSLKGGNGHELLG